MHVVEANDRVGQPAERAGATGRRGRPAPTRRRRSAGRAGRRSLLTIAVLVAGTTLVSGCRPPACAEPFRAARWQEGVTDPAPWPPGSIARPAPSQLFDTDGDGVEDTVVGATGDPVAAVTVRRGSGDLTFTSAFGVVAPVRQLGSDHDGDGRSEIIVSAATQNGYPGSTYVVPGSTPDGSYDPADVGVHLVDNWLPTDENRVGDLDGDGADELVFTGEFETWVFPGAEMMAAGPGDDHPVSPEIRSAALVDPVQIAPGQYALVIVDSADEVILRVDGTELRFTTVNSGLPLTEGDFASMGANIVDGPDAAAWLIVWVTGGDGHLTARWAWDLDSLCDGAAPPSIRPGDD